MPTHAEVVPADVLKQRFANLLFRLHQNVNLLDLNLGLSIRYMENPCDVDRSHSWLAKTNLAGKIEKFLQMVDGKEGYEAELASWCDAARKARCDRNVFTHVYWDFLPLDVDTPIHMHLHPWNSDGLTEDIPMAMSLEAFEVFVNNVEKVFIEFEELRRRMNV